MLNFPLGVRELLGSGGPIFFLLLLLSVYSLAVIWERWAFFRGGIGDFRAFLARERQFIGNRRLQDALSHARSYKGLSGPVIVTVLTAHGGFAEKERAAERVIERQAARLDRGLTTLGTLGSVAPFIGLFGTVIGIIRAFKGLSGPAGGGPDTLAVGIAEALITTATGLLVAIPAYIAYNYFQARRKEFADELALTAEEIIDALSAAPENATAPTVAPRDLP